MWDSSADGYKVNWIHRPIEKLPYLRYGSFLVCSGHDLPITGLEIVNRFDDLIDPDCILNILNDLLHRLVGHGTLIDGALCH